MFSAAFRFIAELTGSAGAAQDSKPLANRETLDRMKGVLSECMERTEDGGWRMSVKFADPKALDSPAEVMARRAARA